MILGIDEVGRGPWAGPLVVGAVVLGGAMIEGLTDSKKLSKKRREELDIIIRDQASGIGLGWVHADELDAIGLSAALVLATKRAVQQVNASYHEIIIDGTVNFLRDTSKGQYVTTLKKADLLIPSVSAASIVAKVARDAYMTEQNILYPGYGFVSHVGYGTAAHIAAIKKLGVTPLHRLSFAPLAKYRVDETGPVVESAPDFRSVTNAKSGAAPLDATRKAMRLLSRSIPSRKDTKATAAQDLTSLTRENLGAKCGSWNERDRKNDQTTKQIGDVAETEAANYLVRLGHEIIDRNWKTKYCEIDIISKKDTTIYFTEVKYRRRSRQGDGLAAITPKKLRQMKFAAEFYVLINELPGMDLRLAAASISGEPPVVETFLKI